jgi:hypothetical protein
MTSLPSSVLPRKRSRWRRFLLGSSASIALVCAGVGLYVVLSVHNTRVRLEDMIARLDSTDPNWRLEDLEKDLPPVPDSVNSAPLLRQIVAQRPANWPAPALAEKLEGISAQHRLTAEQADMIRHELDRSPQSVALIRKLVDFPDCFIPTAWTPDGMSTLLPMVQPAMEIARVATYDVDSRLQARDFDGALESCRAMLSAGRCSGPGLLIYQSMVRLAIQNMCIDKVERVLAPGEPSEQALAKLQDLLLEESRVPFLERGLRGERAMSYRVIHETFKGNADRALVASFRILWDEPIDPLTKIAALSMAPSNGTMEANLAMSLANSTNLLEATKRSVTEQDAQFNRVGKLAKDYRQPPLARLLASPVVNLRKAFQRQQARLSAAITALAAERFRKKHGRWPDKLDDLIPGELSTIEVDPYTGAPLLLRRLNDGLVIYSVGFNRVDDGGIITAQKGEPPDIGVRLWDVDQRGLEPKSSEVKPEK